MLQAKNGICCVALGVAACVLWPAGAFGMEAEGRYISSAGGYSIEFPEGWIIQEIPGTSAVGAKAPQPTPGGATDNVIVSVEAVFSEVLSADAYLALSLETMQKQMPGLANLSKDAFAIGDEDGACFVNSFEMAGTKFNSIQYCVVRGGRAYVVTGTTDADIDERREVFDMVAESLIVETQSGESGGEEAGEPVEAAPLEGDNIYANEEKDFRVQFPADWKIETPESGAVVKGVSPREDPRDYALESASVFARTLSTPMTAREYCDESIRRAQQAAAIMPTGTGVTSIDDEEAAWFSYSKQTMVGEVGQGIMYFLVKDSRAFRIDCTCGPEALERYRPVFASIAGSFRFSAVQEVPPPFEAALYEDEAGVFSILFPAEWTIGGRGTIYAVTAVSPRDGEEDFFSESVSVFVDNVGRTPNLDLYQGRHMAGLKRKNPTVAVMDSSAVTIGGKEARYVLHTMKMGSMTFRNVSYIFAADESVYVVMGSALESSYEQYKPIFEGVAASLKFTKTPEE